MRRIWPSIERWQRACYGPRKKRRVSRPTIYPERILAYELMRGMGWTAQRTARWLERELTRLLREAGMPAEKAKHLAKRSPRTVSRRFNEAVRKIEGVAKAERSARQAVWEDLDSEREWFRDHVLACAICRKAKRSDDLCIEAQRRLPSLTVRQKGVKVPLRWADKANPRHQRGRKIGPRRVNPEDEREGG